jgi:hypothetical protein
VPKDIKLTGWREWDRWFTFSNTRRHTLHVWPIINPDEHQLSEDEMLGLPAEPPAPSAQRRDEVDRRQRRAHERSHGARRQAHPPTRGSAPPRRRTSDRLARKRYLRAVQAHNKTMNQAAGNTSFAAVQRIYALIVSTVDADLLYRAMDGLMADGQAGVRALLRRLEVLTRRQHRIIIGTIPEARRGRHRHRH